MTTTNVPGSQMVHKSFDDGTRMIPGRGRHADELWIMIGAEVIDDWNYWIVLRPEYTYGPLVFSEIVPWDGFWWGMEEFPHYELIVPTAPARLRRGLTCQY